MLRSTVSAIGAAIAIFCSVAATNAQQSFSCSFGSEPACLDYGAVVCKSGAKCVARDSVCFDSFTCDYKGFVCKSALDEAAAEIDDKVRRYNALVEEFNTLQSAHRNLVDCLSGASSLEAFQACR